MRIGGFQRFSLIDYPEKRAAVVFTQGCNFRCPYCHNSELAIPSLYQSPFNQKAVKAFLKKRQGALEAVVVTGGEPTLQKELIPFLDEIKKMGYLTKLDTNGSNPDILESVIDKKLVDYVAMDVKSSLENYHHAAGVKVKTEAIERSIKVLLKGDVPYQFRTTVCRPICNEKDLKAILKLIEGADEYRLQKFVDSGHIVNPSFASQSQFTQEEFEALQKAFQY